MVLFLSELGHSTGIFTFMNTQWGWPAIESLHFIGLTFLLGTVGLFDLRLLGVGRGIPIAALHGLVPWGVAGFALNVVTGFMFLVSDPGQYVHNPAFQLKMLAMLIAGLNLLVFYAVLAPRVRALPHNVVVPRAARTAALISLICWIAVISFGRLITFYRPPEFWCFWCVAP
ncbi:hypothetical protein PHACT_03340 [Pseudohongiella acticola]|uniref:DUF6644 domain-containing protein n=1 Tax=Pseudohongiella acticola TaxID=1524254 RepID=A0A1E8CIK7_9GAMM|nr:DUF6644 family protein [Pseudohongiella acticola]OFE12286.1 hypothetical protein PHACT_03340 [Pseudohongiella acticola]